MAQTTAAATRQFRTKKLSDRELFRYAKEARRANEPIRVFSRGSIFIVYASGVYQYIGEGRR